MAVDHPAGVAVPNPTAHLAPASKAIEKDAAPQPVLASAAPAPASSPASAVAPTPAAASASAAAPGSGAGFTVGAAAEITDDKDGWKRADGRFLFKGSGTDADPYVLPWEILVSASESYSPRLGKKEIPQRVMMLKGKKVRLSGYVLFPLMSTQATELLLMRNQWDGCCIGVPPTPYDAIEVKLSQPAERKDMFISFVTIEGTLDVDPFLKNDFLLGLYTMSGASMAQPTKASSADKGI